MGLRPKPKMPPKKKQKLIKGQSFISFGRPNEQTEYKVDKSDPGPNEQTEDKVDKSDPGPSTQTATESDQQKLSEKEGQKVKEKRPRVFQQNWKVLHTWLIYEDGAMFCSLCPEAGCKNPFSQKGCINFKTSALTEHVAGQDHREALCVPAQQKNAKKKRKKSWWLQKKKVPPRDWRL